MSSIIMSGLRHDKKIIEKSEEEIEIDFLKEKKMLEKIEANLEKIEAKM